MNEQLQHAHEFNCIKSCIGEVMTDVKGHGAVSNDQKLALNDMLKRAVAAGQKAGVDPKALKALSDRVASVDAIAKHTADQRAQRIAARQQQQKDKPKEG